MLLISWKGAMQLTAHLLSSALSKDRGWFSISLDRYFSISGKTHWTQTQVIQNLAEAVVII